MKDGSVDTKSLYDAVIIGGGPAGLTAAVYLARARYRVLVLEKAQFGGQITITNEVVNYPGILSISGSDLTENMKSQAESFGAEFLTAEAVNIKADSEIKTVYTNKGEFSCLSVLIATGAHPRNVGFKGEEEFKGRGVAYCATCDGEFFTDKEIFVIGGGYAAAEESVFLTKFASHVTVLIRKSDFSCAASVANEAKNHEKITVLTNTVVEEVSGDGGLRYIRYKNTETGKVTEYNAKENNFFGVFVFVGYSPNTEFVKELVKLNEQGYVVTDSSQQTSLKGVFAAGDVCIKPLRQVVTATGDGALAATEMEKYIAQIQEETGLHSELPEPKKISAAKKTLKSDYEPSDSMFTSEIKKQLEELFSKMESKLILSLCLDERAISREAEEFAVKLCELTDKLSCEIAQRNADSEIAPCIKILRWDKSESGLAFHGVPGGHEFTSFVLGLYNTAGPGQKLDDGLYNEIKAIDKKIRMKILVSLSCTMCPDLVVACQHIAAENPNVTAEVYDINHFEALRKKYSVMSVPCLVFNDGNVSFGKKSMGNVLELIRNSDI